MGRVMLMGVALLVAGCGSLPQGASTAPVDEVRDMRAKWKAAGFGEPCRSDAFCVVVTDDARRAELCVRNGQTMVDRNTGRVVDSCLQPFKANSAQTWCAIVKQEFVDGWRHEYLHLLEYCATGWMYEDHDRAWWNDEYRRGLFGVP